MKTTVDDLALFGGRAAFTEPLAVGRPGRIDRRALYERLDRVLDSGCHSNGGPLVRELEGRLAGMAGVRHCVAMCNATTAMQVLARARGVTGEVVMPSMTFVATAHAMRWIGLEPVFCDIDPDTGQIDPAHARALITPRTSAVVGVHLWGRPCPVDALEDLVAEHGLDLYFDAAHAIGCAVGGRPVGGSGDAEVFSLHATKVVGAFEGGAVVTDDDRTAERLRSLQSFGTGIAELSPFGGTNAKMGEASAAMALTSLDAFADTVRHNRGNHEAYRAGLTGVPGIALEDFVPAESPNFQYVVIRVDPARTGLDRDLLQRVLHEENILTRPYFSPACHQTEPYASLGHAALPHTEHLAERVLALPTGTAVSPEDVGAVCDIIRLTAARGAEVTARAHGAVRERAMAPAGRAALPVTWKRPTTGAPR
ncbi:aminotransferase class I/II-fold pyridoxal phosphate-dependent enzyme [Nocardiopsis sp. NPDC058631]|uniref:aminotransferase class I/II-fold pyridoxal phosphate-dependent enzyme n=1 Tax=Nocardiopsis sp. NPDC058631 TaxID=3346566 RepID=UPI00365E6C9E